MNGHPWMPTWFFDDPDAVAKLLAARDAWAGTPFAKWSRAQGPHGGIPCIPYVEEIMAAAGLPRFDFPVSESDYSRHVHHDKVLNYLRGKSEDPQSARLAEIFAEFPLVVAADALPVEAAVPAAAPDTGATTADGPDTGAATADAPGTGAATAAPGGDFSEPTMIGDLLILKDAGRHGRTGNGIFHMLVMTGRRKFTQCAPRLGVHEGNIDDPTYRKILVAHFRARALA